MDSLRQKVCDISRTGVFVTLSIFVILVGYPLAILIFVPLFAYRQMVEHLVKIFYPKFGETLKGLDAVLSAHTPYSNPTVVLLPTFFLDKPIDRIRLVGIFNEKFIQFRDHHGNRVYERLRQKIVSKFGYHFWHEVDTFDLFDHIRYLDESCPDRVIKQEEFMQLTCELSKRPFDKNRSPWEIILIPKFENDKDSSIKSVLIMRFHHCICDGFSFLKIFEGLGVNPWQHPKNMEKANKPLGLIQSIIIPTLRLLFEAPYAVLVSFLFAEDENDWLTKAIKKPSGTLSSQETGISLNDLKHISKTFSSGEKVNVASIAVTLVAQATARAMKRKGAKGDLANHHVILPWPLSNHPGVGLCNYWTSVKLRIHLDFEDLRQTVRNVSREYERLKNSVIPQTSAVITTLVGSLPVSLIPNAEKLVRSSCLFSNFPGPGHPIDLCGSNVKDMFVMASPARGCAVGSLSFSYNGTLRYIIGGDQSNVDQDDANFLAKSCQEIARELLVTSFDARNKELAMRNKSKFA